MVACMNDSLKYRPNFIILLIQTNKKPQIQLLIKWIVEFYEIITHKSGIKVK